MSIMDAPPTLYHNPALTFQRSTAVELLQCYTFRSRRRQQSTITQELSSVPLSLLVLLFNAHDIALLSVAVWDGLDLSAKSRLPGVSLPRQGPPIVLNKQHLPRHLGWPRLQSDSVSPQAHLHLHLRERMHLRHSDHE